jgi:hypothetical protein
MSVEWTLTPTQYRVQHLWMPRLPLPTNKITGSSPLGKFRPVPEKGPAPAEPCLKLVNRLQPLLPSQMSNAGIG